MAWWLAALDERITCCIDLCCLTDFEALIEMIERGDINPRIDSIFDLADFEEAFERMTSRRAMGKVLLNIA